MTARKHVCARCGAPVTGVGFTWKHSRSAACGRSPIPITQEQWDQQPYPSYWCVILEQAENHIQELRQIGVDPPVKGKPESLYALKKQRWLKEIGS